MTYLEQLNDEQLRAVKDTEGYLRVIAGAGSGKTRLLVSRYAYLVSEYGISPSGILCVTFTNKAASEMKERIKRLLGRDFDSSLICTIRKLPHSEPRFSHCASSACRCNFISVRRRAAKILFR